MIQAMVSALTCCLLLCFTLFSQFAVSAPLCSSYQELSAQDRQNISDTRYEFANLPLDTSDSEFKARFNELFNTHSKGFTSTPMSNALQGLMAEAIFRRYIYQSLGLENLAFKRFQIFADLIIDHRAMEHKAFVSPEIFAQARVQLEAEINRYFQQQESVYISEIQISQKILLQQMSDGKQIAVNTQSQAQQFADIENRRRQMLGAIDIMWSQLLMRNQFNHTETMADIAIVETSINAATAIVGFTALVGYGPSLLNTARTLWSMPLSIAVGCGFGVSSRLFSDSANASYLEISRALYKSVQNQTSFACELGEQMNPESRDPAVVIPYEKPGASAKDYIISCASAGTSMVFPKAAGLAFSGLLMASLTASSYHLVQESMVLLEEIPNLYRMREHMKSTRDREAIAALEKRIIESEAKVTLYLMAMGNSTVEAIKTGFFLYGGRHHVKDVIAKAKEFLAGRPITDSVDLQLLRIILGGIFQ